MQKILVFAFAVVLLAACGEKMPDKSGKEILLELNSVASKLNTIDFSVDYFYDDMTDEREAYKAKVDIYMERNISSKNQNAPFNFLIKRDDNTTIIYKDDISYLVDGNNQTVTLGYYDSLNYVLGVDGSYFQQMLTEMIFPSDYSQMINQLQDTISVLPNEKFNGEECYVINTEKYYAEYQVTMIERTWISVKDKLPRKAERYQVQGTDSLKIINTFTIRDKDFAFDKSKLSLDFAKDYAQEVFKPKPKPQPLVAGAPAPDFELLNQDGKTVKLSDYRGKVLLIDFWGTWCVWCIKSFPKLEAAYEALKGKPVEFLGISCQEPADADPVKFAREKGLTYPILLNGDGVAQSFAIEGYPTFYIIDKEGKVVLSQSGFSETLDQFIIDEVNKKL